MKYVVLAFFGVVFVGCANKVKQANAPEAPKVESNAAKETTKPKTPPAVKPTTSADGAVVCSLGSNTRELKIVTEGEKCTVQYARDGETKQMGQGNVSSSFCSNLVKRIQGNLEGAGYTCN